MWCLLTAEYEFKHAAKIRSCSAVNVMFSSATCLEFQLLYVQGDHASGHRFRWLFFLHKCENSEGWHEQMNVHNFGFSQIEN